MLDAKIIRSDPQQVASDLARRGYQFDSNAFTKLDGERKQFDVGLQELQAQRNQASKKVGALIKEGRSVDEAKAEVQQTLDKIDSQLNNLKQSQAEAQRQLDQLLLNMPNIPADDVPEGEDENANLEISRWGEPSTFDFDVNDHVAIGESLRQLDFESASKITGSRFVLMRGEIARLHRALIQFMLDIHRREHGYEEIYVPFIVNRDSMTGTGQLPKFAADSFKLELDQEQDYYLIPTAEVPVTNLLRDVIVDADNALGLNKLPLKFVCHSPCFRSEAGSYGRDTRGMIRQHQFEKVELVQIVRPQDSVQAHEDLTQHAENILQRLELPYRKVSLCGGDLGFAARKTYDLEVWLPAQNCYREISSCSNFSDFQARRMQARWRNPETGKPELVHTLNGSGLAIGRTLVAVLENYQNADGSVTVPHALQNYLDGLDRINV
ncbi:MAG: serine--tRNA ligase [Pseudomonadales bacterium]